MLNIPCNLLCVSYLLHLKVKSTRKSAISQRPSVFENGSLISLAAILCLWEVYLPPQIICNSLLKK